MSHRKGFELQRRKGTGQEKLTEEEREAKAQVEARFADCLSFTEVRDRLEKMADADEFVDAQQNVDDQRRRDREVHFEQLDRAGNEDENEHAPVQPPQMNNPDTQILMQMMKTMAEGFQAMQSNMNRMNDWQIEVDRERRQPAAATPQSPGATERQRQKDLDRALGPTLNPLPKFKLKDGATEFIKWKLSWKHHCKYLERIYGTKRPDRLSYDFFNAMDFDVQAWIEAQPNLKDVEDPIVVMEALERHLFGKTTPGFVIRERLEKKQEEGESIENLHFANEYAANYALKDFDRVKMFDLLMGQFLISQVRDPRMRRMLIGCQHEGYEVMYKKAREREETDQRASKLEQQTINTTSTYQAGRGRGRNQSRGRPGQGQGWGRGRGKRDASHGRSPSRQRDKCQRCGREPHKRNDCPANNEECRNCKKIGHFQSMCRSRGKSNTRQSRSRTRENVRSHDDDYDDAEEDTKETLTTVGTMVMEANAEKVNAVRDLECIVVEVRNGAKSEKIDACRTPALTST